MSDTAVQCGTGPEDGILDDVLDDLLQESDLAGETATDDTDGGEGGAGGKNEGSTGSPDPEEATTWQCGLPSCAATGTKRCTSCKAAYYCSQQHQRSHWKVHKVKCRGGTASKNGQQAPCIGAAHQSSRIQVPFGGVSSEYFAEGPSTASSEGKAGGTGAHSDKYDELVLKSAEPGFSINTTRMSDGHLPILFGEIVLLTSYVCLAPPALLPIGYNLN